MQGGRGQGGALRRDADGCAGLYKLSFRAYTEYPRREQRGGRDGVRACGPCVCGAAHPAVSSTVTAVPRRSPRNTPAAPRNIATPAWSAAPQRSLQRSWTHRCPPDPPTPMQLCAVRGVSTQMDDMRRGMVRDAPWPCRHALSDELAGGMRRGTGSIYSRSARRIIMPPRICSRDNCNT